MKKTDSEKNIQWKRKCKKYCGKNINSGSKKIVKKQ